MHSSFKHAMSLKVWSTTFCKRNFCTQHIYNHNILTMLHFIPPSFCKGGGTNQTLSKSFVLTLYRQGMRLAGPPTVKKNFLSPSTKEWQSFFSSSHSMYCFKAYEQIQRIVNKYKKYLFPPSVHFNNLPQTRRKTLFSSIN